jgi:tetratricopeptide (TPR) repeat protein
MRVSRHISFFFFLILLSLGSSAQLGFDLDIKKPEPYDNRVLKAEKSGDKKLNKPRRFFQNLTTHYNYFFNANTKLNEILDRAKGGHRDDYAQLLSFYNYTLDGTKQDKQQLDSVIYKSKTGIVMHDLRSDWADDLYLLWGQAYFLQKEFDSAFQMFQFINWAFAEKEKDGYYKYIGSRMDGNEALSIATKEDPNFFQKLTSDPPSRNNALLWLSRVFIETGRGAEASSLIATLKTDPNFPKRLNSELEEIQAYWFYKQGMWDSSATHLVNAFDRAKNKQERSRWEFLAAQMFDRTGKTELSEELYADAIKHTTDPVLDIYARLNLVRINKDGGENYLEKNIDELKKMARRDKYVDYRDVIYFMMAQMEMERNNFDAAQAYLIKGAGYNNGNIGSKSKAFLQIADLSYTQRKYVQAAAFYDSIQMNELDSSQQVLTTNRKEFLSKLVPYLNSVALQDSLQKLAALPEAERDALIKKLVKRIRKEQGLGDEGDITTLPVAATSNDIFPQQTKGEWYFYNASSKTQGVQRFKQVWGNRPNRDNWRRTTVGFTPGGRNNDLRSNPSGSTVQAAVDNTAPTYASVLAKLPLTESQIKLSNDSIQDGLYQSGIIYVTQMEDYISAIEAFESLRSRFPDFNKMPEVLFQLYYAYSKTGNQDAAARLKKLLTEKYPSSKAAMVLNGGNKQEVQFSNTVTKEYERIYDLFLEGRFEEAKEAKRIADSTYGTTTWQPQLLYIAAVYHIQKREDSVARTILQTLMMQNQNTPIAVKAQNLVNVLSRRAQIEEELSKYEIVQRQEDTVVKTETPRPLPVRTDNINTKPKDTTATNKPVIVPKKDTIVTKTLPPQVKTSSLYTYDPNAKHFVVVVLNKVDKVFGNEARNAFFRYNREKHAGQPLNLQLIDLDADNKLLLIGEFNSIQTALDYVQKAKPIAASEIVPWLKGDKYSFSLISAPNLEVLKANPALDVYRKFLEQNLPVKF